MANVARDARTLLGALNANVEWLKSGFLDEVPPSHLLEALLDLETCCDRLTHLLEDALVGTRENGLTVQRSSISLASIFSAALKQVRRTAAAKGISVDIVAEREIAAMLDRGLLTRAVAKLMRRTIAECEPGAQIVLSYRLVDGQLVMTFARNDAAFLALCASGTTLHSAEPKGPDDDATSELAFCHFAAECHGGTLTVGSGAALYRLALPWIDPARY